MTNKTNFRAKGIFNCVPRTNAILPIGFNFDTVFIVSFGNEILCGLCSVGAHIIHRIIFLSNPPMPKEWHRITAQNGLPAYRLDGKECSIVYNPNSRKGNNKFFYGLTDSETSIVYEGRYFILNGDHRAQYEKLIGKGYAYCKTYYLKHADQRSMWSDDNDFVNLQEFSEHVVPR